MLEVRGSDELSQLFAGYNQTLKDFDSLLINIKRSAIRLKPMSIELSETTMGLSQRNQLQLAQNLEIGRELEMLNAAAANMQRQSQDIIAAAGKGSDAINKGQAVVNGAYEGINKLAGSIESSMSDVDQLQQASIEIGEAIGVIQSIAEETNLLALNAAIEAARAGEFGRGFSVVADEVRNLSNKTQQSTKAVEAMVSAIQKAAGSVVETMREGESLANNNAQMMGMARNSFGNIEEITQCSVSIAESTQNQVSSLQVVTDINNEMNELNNDIMNFSKQSGLSETDLVNLSEHIFSHIANYKLSKTHFDMAPRINLRNLENVKQDKEKQTNQTENDNIELF